MLEPRTKTVGQLKNQPAKGGLGTGNGRGTTSLELDSTLPAFKFSFSFSMLSQVNVYFGMDEAKIQYVNQHASNSPFFTGLLMYFSILSLCHSWDYGLTYESLGAWAQQWDIYQDLYYVFGGEFTWTFLTWYIVIALMYAATFQTQEPDSVHQAVTQLFRTYGTLNWGTQDASPEYSEALIQHHLDHNLTYSAVEYEQGPLELALVAQERILTVFLTLMVVYLAMDEYLWGWLFTQGTTLELAGLWFYPHIAGRELGVLLTSGLGNDFASVLGYTTEAHHALWADGAAGGLFSSDVGAANDLQTLQTVFGYEYVDAFYTQDVCCMLVSYDGSEAVTVVGGPVVDAWVSVSKLMEGTTLLGSKTFFLLLLSIVAFLLGTYNGIYVLSTSDDSFMNKELHRIGHFHTEENVWFGFKLFLLSEVLIFAGFFGGLFFYMLVPAVAIGNSGPPHGLPAMDVFSVPLLNTCLLVTSGMAITGGHIALGNLTQLLRARPFLTQE